MGYLDQHGWLLHPFTAHLVQVGPELFLAALFVVSVFSGDHALELSDDVVAMSHQAGSDTPSGDRSQKLLGPAAANTEQRLENRPVYPGIGSVLQLPDGGGDTVEPERGLSGMDATSGVSDHWSYACKWRNLHGIAYPGQHRRLCTIA